MMTDRERVARAIWAETFTVITWDAGEEAAHKRFLRFADAAIEALAAQAAMPSMAEATALAEVAAAAYSSQMKPKPFVPTCPNCGGQESEIIKERQTDLAVYQHRRCGACHRDYEATEGGSFKTTDKA